jgi:formamidopyrimidine-DNA glycosylase
VPELPDITVYIEALERRILGHDLQRADIASPFLVRTERTPSECVGHKVKQLRRIGKRVAVGFDNDAWLVFHLMIAGRLHWTAKAKKPDGRRTLAAFIFDSGCLTLTEAGSRKRASLNVVRGEDELTALDPGGIDVFSASQTEFARVLTSSNHTLKRSLTDPRLFSGIGNAYSDEILHRARLSPILLTSRIAPDEIARLHDSVKASLAEWIDRLRKEAGDGFPEKVTAFRPEMAVHGRYGQPCPVCGTKVQRIRHASNETNYCPQCQTGGRLLADRALSRLLREDWPRSLEELEEMRRH